MQISLSTFAEGVKISELFLIGILVTVALGLGVAVIQIISIRHNPRLLKIIKDTSVVEKIEELSNLCSGSTEILISTDLDPRFFGNEKIKDSIHDAVRKGAMIRILYDPRANKTLEDGLPYLYEMVKKGKILAKPTHGGESHIMIFDRRHIRLEKPHKFQEFGREGDEGRILFNQPKLGEEVARRFYKSWERTR